MKREPPDVSPCDFENNPPPVDELKREFGWPENRPPVTALLKKFLPNISSDCFGLFVPKSPLSLSAFSVEESVGLCVPKSPLSFAVFSAGVSTGLFVPKSPLLLTDFSAGASTGLFVPKSPTFLSLSLDLISTFF